MSLTTEVMSVRESGSQKKVELMARAPRMSPQMFRETRAKLVALRAVGVIDTVEDVTTDIISKQELNRMTTVMSHKRAEEQPEFGVNWKMVVYVRNS